MSFFNHPLLKEGKVTYREYQDILARRVLERGNTLLVLPTGLGKTIIAILVTVQKLQAEPDKKVLFLAPTKPLVNQHFNSFKELTKVGGLAVLTGEIKESARNNILKQAKVIFATPQTIENALFKGNLDPGQFSLVIFDEAHRAVGDYAYVFIAERFARTNPNALILAMTASPGGTREKIQNIVQNLFIKNVEVKTERDEDVKRYIPGKKEVWITVEFPPQMDEARKVIRNIEKELTSELKEKEILRTSRPTKKQLLELQNKLAKEASRNPTLYHVIPRVSALVKLSHLGDLLETQGPSQFASYIERLKKDNTKGAKLIRGFPDFSKLEYMAKKLGNQIHPKLGRLVDILKSPENQDKKAIVFAHYRESAKLIEEYLNAIGIPARRFIGQASKEGEKGLKQQEQIQLINDFKSGKFRILVATSVGEEGIDIPSVDLVIFYEQIASEIRKIQRAGRTGRKMPGKVIYLITKGTRDEAYYWAGKHKERTMRKTLEEMTSYDQRLQRTLSEFVVSERPEKPTIFVDDRELKTGIVDALIEMGIQVKQIRLPVGDYLISDRVVVERKTADDFVNSIIDGRLFEQAQALKENFERPVIVIEGNDFSHRNMHPNAIRGALASLVMDYGIPVVQTNALRDTAELMAVMAKRELEKGRLARLRGERKPAEDRALQLYLVEGLPGVGPALARELLRRFKTVERVFTAGEKELKNVEKVGEKRAKEIRRILTKEWKDEEDQEGEGQEGG